MRNTFSHYFRPTPQQFERLWRECLFAIDANVLLNLYRYSSESQTELLDILKQLSAQIWIPHQAASEFLDNRLLVIQKQKDAYATVKRTLTENQRTLESCLRNFLKHPSLNAAKIINNVSAMFASLRKEVEDAEQAHLDLLAEDPLKETILDRLVTLLDGKIGEKYSEEKVAEIWTLGKDRYDKCIPPGFRDADKSEEERYGDLILWFQLIDKSKSTQKPIILVTDDTKDDWWWEFQGKTIGPRKELLIEMQNEASTLFYMYNTDRFVEEAQKYLSRATNPKVIDEIRHIRQANEALSLNMLMRESAVLQEEQRKNLMRLRMLHGKFTKLTRMELSVKEAINQSQNEIDMRQAEDKLQKLEFEMNAIKEEIARCHHQLYETEERKRTIRRIIDKQKGDNIIETIETPENLVEIFKIGDEILVKCPTCRNYYAGNECSHCNQTNNT